MDLHLPDGSTVTVTPTTNPPEVVGVPGGGKVTVIINGTDSEGVQDAQIWAGEGTVSPGVISGPGLLGAPSSNSPNTGSAGGNACTQVIVSQNLTLHGTSSNGNFFEVSARAVNFGGLDV